MTRRLASGLAFLTIAGMILVTGGCKPALEAPKEPETVQQKQLRKEKSD